MKTWLLGAWLLLPVLAISYHFGPGQDHLRLDKTAKTIAVADAAAARARSLTAAHEEGLARDAWTEAEKAYSEAIASLPSGRRSEERSLRLARAKAKMWISRLPEARDELTQLVAELNGDPAADARQKTDATESLASANYYTTWLMRLQGEPESVWLPEIEGARQRYRALAEDADARRDTAAAKLARENIESAIRLARMELSDLQGLPLPSQ